MLTQLYQRRVADRRLVGTTEVNAGISGRGAEHALTTISQIN